MASALGGCGGTRRAGLLCAAARADSPAREQRRELALLPHEVRRHLLEHVLEHRERIERRSLGERPVAHRLLPALDYVRIELLLEPCLPLLGPFAERDQMAGKPFDGIAER